jgi:HD-like signal output (HDOD) protein
LAAQKIDTQFYLKKLDELPSLPSIVYELSRIINDPMSSTKEVEEVMATDIGMTAKVLKLANSAYYAIPGGVTSLSRAIAFIGFDTIHQLVLSSSIIDALKTNGAPRFNINEFWKHSVAVAIGAETIGKHTGHPNPGDMFTSGLVHDMGKVALYICVPDLLTEILKHVDEHKSTFLDAEKVISDIDHNEIGGLLSEKWKLPKAISAAAKFHHETNPNVRGGLSPEINMTVDIVVLSNLLIHALKFGNSGHTKILGAPTDLLARLRITDGEMGTVVRTIKANLEKASDFIRMIGGEK